MEGGHCTTKLTSCSSSSGRSSSSSPSKTLAVCIWRSKFWRSSCMQWSYRHSRVNLKLLRIQTGLNFGVSGILRDQELHRWVKFLKCTILLTWYCFYECFFQVGNTVKLTINSIQDLMRKRGALIRVKSELIYSCLLCARRFGIEYRTVVPSHCNGCGRAFVFQTG